jgi:hypothetical protein
VSLHLERPTHHSLRAKVWHPISKKPLSERGSWASPLEERGWGESYSHLSENTQRVSGIGSICILYCEGSASGEALF